MTARRARRGSKTHALNKLERMSTAAVNYDTEKAQVEFAHSVRKADLVRVIGDAG